VNLVWFGDGGGTARKSCWTFRKSRGLLTAALSALVRSSAEKESLRGIGVRGAGRGMASVMFALG
jgi:hypothetical protein